MGITHKTYVAIVDDEPSMCRSLSRLLQATYFQAVCYLSAEEFLADSKHPHFDCLVLDIQLKGMSGLDLHRRLRAVNDHTPVIYVTAHDDTETRAQAEELKCAAFLRKTDPGIEVVAAIHCACGSNPSDSSGNKGKPNGPSK
jgi:FixJ family two-component response regulator